MALCICVILLLNSLLGLLLFEYAWKQLKPLRQRDEARDSQFPPFRRTDVAQWKKWKFIPGAITLLPLRLLSSGVTIVAMFLIVKYSPLSD